MERSPSRSSFSSRRSSLDSQNQQVEQESGASTSSSRGIYDWVKHIYGSRQETGDSSSSAMGRQLSSKETPDPKRARNSESTSLFDRITSGIFRQQESDIGTLAQTVTQLEKAYQLSPNLEQLQRLGEAYKRYLQGLDSALQEKEGKLGEIQVKQGYYKMLELYNEQIEDDTKIIRTQGSIAINVIRDQSVIDESKERRETLLPLREGLLQEISALGQSSNSLQSQETSLEREIDQLEGYREQATACLTGIEKKQQEIQKKQQEIQKKQQELSQLLSLAPHEHLTTQLFGPNVSYAPYEVGQTTLTPNMESLTLPDIPSNNAAEFTSLLVSLDNEDLSMEQFANQIIAMGNIQQTAETSLASQVGQDQPVNKGKKVQKEQDIFNDNAKLSLPYQMDLRQERLKEQETLMHNDSNLAEHLQQEEYNIAPHSDLEIIEDNFDNYPSQGNEPIQSTSREEASSSFASPSAFEIPPDNASEHGDNWSITTGDLNFFEEDLTDPETERTVVVPNDNRRFTNRPSFDVTLDAHYFPALIDAVVASKQPNAPNFSSVAFLQSLGFTQLNPRAAVVIADNNKYALTDCLDKMQLEDNIRKKVHQSLLMMLNSAREAKNARRRVDNMTDEQIEERREKHKVDNLTNIQKEAKNVKQRDARVARLDAQIFTLPGVGTLNVNPSQKEANISSVFPSISETPRGQETPEHRESESTTGRVESQSSEEIYPQNVRTEASDSHDLY